MFRCARMCSDAFVYMRTPSKISEVLGVFRFKNDGEIPSIWRHVGARLGDQKVKDYIVYFHVLSHKLNFLENPRIKREHKQRAYWMTKWGIPGAAKRQASRRVQRFSGRPQGASTTRRSLEVFEAFRPHTPCMKYLHGGHPPPSN